MPLIASTIYCQPWHILPEAHGEIGALYQKYLRGDLAGRVAQERRAVELPASRAEGYRVSSGLAWAYDTELGDGLAVIWLDGVIAKRCPDSMSGPPIVDLAKLDAVVQELREMEEIGTVVLCFDSPGGCGIGLPESAANIEDLAMEKRTVAYTDYQMCSAAYWLAAACDEIYCAPSSMIGSIGTYIAALDSTRAFEMEGLELKLYRHGTLKAMGLPGKTWTQEEEQFLTDLVATHGEEFRDWVRSNRPGIEDASMEGQVHFGKEAPAGLHDGLMRDLGELVAALVEAA